MSHEQALAVFENYKIRSNKLSTICRRLKMKASDGKMRQTDHANVKGLL
jgi:hypothetical protein